MEGKEKVVDARFWQLLVSKIDGAPEGLHLTSFHESYNYWKPQIWTNLVESDFVRETGSGVSVIKASIVKNGWVCIDLYSFASFQ